MDTISTKRLKGNTRSEASPVTIKNIGKGAAEKAEEVVEERQDDGEEVVAVEEKGKWGGGLWSVVDEEMSWATCWFPFWEMEAVGNAYDTLYGDVMLDYDIWGLKGTGNTSSSNP